MNKTLYSEIEQESKANINFSLESQVLLDYSAKAIQTGETKWF